MNDIQHLMSQQGPKPVGPFSHAVRAGDFLFVTGQMPTMPDDPSKVVDGGIKEQTHRVMENLKLVLEGLESSLDRIVFARVYLVNFQDFDRMKKLFYRDRNKSFPPWHG
jgi:2-iminobutanoate/2-iminopropanoate deaminase